MGKKSFRALRFIFRFISFFIGLALLLAAGLAGAALYSNAPPREAPLSGGDFPGAKREDGGTVLFEVREGETAYGIGQRLEQAGLIKNPVFLEYPLPPEKGFS